MRVRQDIVPAIDRPRYTGIESASPPHANGWATLSVQFETEVEARSYVLSFGPQIEVLRLEALVQKVIGPVHSTAALNAQRACTCLTSSGGCRALRETTSTTTATGRGESSLPAATRGS
jgi:hypothetical protein